MAVKKIIAILGFYFFLNSCESDNTVTICISKTSYKYHSKRCKGVKACTHEIKKVSIAEAKEMGKTPCGYCY